MNQTRGIHKNNLD